MAGRKKKKAYQKRKSDEKNPSRFLPADPPARSPLLLTLSIILLVGWLGLLGWIVARIV